MSGDGTTGAWGNGGNFRVYGEARGREGEGGRAVKRGKMGSGAGLPLASAGEGRENRRQRGKGESRAGARWRA